MPKALLTDISIRALKPPDTGQVTIWDTNSPVGVRLSQGGSKTFITIVSSGRRHVIGRWPSCSLSLARKEALRIQAEKTLGIAKPTPTITFDEARSLYLEECKRKNRPETVKSYTRLLGYLRLKGDLNDIEPREVVRQIDKLADRPSAHHHCIVAARIFFAWCVRKHHIDRSPMERVTNRNTQQSRERVLTDEELKIVYKAARSGKTAFHTFVALALVLGQRRGEIAALKWEWIDEKERLITLPSHICKNKRTHRFPYGEAAATIFASIPNMGPYLFPAEREQKKGKAATVMSGWGKRKVAFDKEVQIAPWTIHDLRRTFASKLAQLGTPIHVTERLLNHVSGSHGGIVAVYQKHSYIPEMRQACAAFDHMLEALTKEA